MQLSVGSRWTDQTGREFVVDAIDKDGVETWVTYTRVSNCTSYSCWAEAFIHRFKEKIQ